MTKTHHSLIRIAVLLFCSGLISTQATTVYVDQRATAPGKGTPEEPYPSIQVALDDKESSEVIVYPGRYTENLRIQRSILLRGYDGPHTTAVDGSASTGSRQDVITIDPGLEVWIEGLTITSGVRYGVLQPTDGRLHLRNNIICGNGADGIRTARDKTVKPQLYVYNCLLTSNSGSGLFLVYQEISGYPYSPDVTVFNTLFVGNSRYGIEANSNEHRDGRITLDYNDAVDNGLGNYFTSLFGPGKPIPTGAHSITVAPEFVGGTAVDCSLDFRLLVTSPCRDTGHPGNGFLDPDGTRNDMGPYGGPAAQTFYTNPQDGPFIRSVTIDQSIVPRGGTITIRTTGGSH